MIEQLKANLLDKYPALKIAGAESPPFRALTPEEDAAVVRRINDSGAGLVFIGIGCPKQEHFAYEHRQSIKGVQVCVGAAFDFHAGRKKTAPALDADAAASNGCTASRRSRAGCGSATS